MNESNYLYENFCCSETKALLFEYEIIIENYSKFLN